jgi:general secretion pathway protein G
MMFHTPRTIVRAAPCVHRASRGFTLLEMLIVIGIILALGGLVLVNLMSAREKSERDIELAQIQGFAGALDMFRLDMKRFPTEEEGLAVLWSKDAMQDETLAATWRAYLNEPKPRDTWGTEYIYNAPSQKAEGKPYDIISLGPDKQEGTEDDISNHDGKAAADGSGIGEDFGDFAPSGTSGGSGG